MANFKCFCMPLYYQVTSLCMRVNSYTLNSTRKINTQEHICLMAWEHSLQLRPPGVPAKTALFSGSAVHSIVFTVHAPLGLL